MKLLQDHRAERTRTAEELRLAVAHAEALEQGHIGGKKRFSNVETRKSLAFQNHDVVTSASEQVPGRRSRGTSADHEDITVPFGCGRAHDA